MLRPVTVEQAIPGSGIVGQRREVAHGPSSRGTEVFTPHRLPLGQSMLSLCYKYLLPALMAISYLSSISGKLRSLLRSRYYRTAVVDCSSWVATVSWRSTLTRGQPLCHDIDLMAGGEIFNGSVFWSTAFMILTLKI